MADKKTKSKTGQTKAVKTKTAAKAKPVVKESKVSSIAAGSPKADKKTSRLAKVADRKIRKDTKKSKRTSRKVWKPLHILGLIFWPRFLRNSFKELRQVTWLSLKGSIALTVAVLFFAIIFVVFIGLIDMGLDRLFKALFLK